MYKNTEYIYIVQHKLRFCTTALIGNMNNIRNFTVIDRKRNKAEGKYTLGVENT